MRHSFFVLAVLLTATACDSGGAEPLADSAPNASPVSVSSTAAAESASASNAPTTTATSVAATAAPPTTAPPTTAPPAAARLIGEPVDAPGVRPQAERIVDTAEFDGGLAVLGMRSDTIDSVGSMVLWRATGDAYTAYTFESDSVIQASQVAIEGDRWAVVGYELSDDGSAPLIWRSTDGGASFDAPQPIIDAEVRVLDAVLLDGSYTMVVADGVGENRSLSVLRETADGAPNEIPLPSGDGTFADAVAVVAAGDQLVVVGTVTLDDVARARVWSIAPDGTTAVHSDLPEHWAAFVDVSRDGGSLIAAVDTPSGTPPLLARSTDGMSWEPIELTLDRDGEPRTLQAAELYSVVAYQGGYALSFNDGYAMSAVVDDSGSGSYLQRMSPEYGVPTWAQPYVVNDALFGVTEFAATFEGVSYESTNSVVRVWQLDGSEFGRRASGVSILGGRTALAASEAWPEIDSVMRDGIMWTSWGPVSTVFQPSDGEWERVAEPSPLSDIDDFATTGDRQLAISYTRDDPNEPLVTGPTGRTIGNHRVGDGSWSSAIDLASGPGSNEITAWAGEGDGFVLAGYSNVADEAGTESYEPILKNVRGDSVTDANISADIAGVTLEGVAIADNGVAVAAGHRRLADGWARMALHRSADETWVELALRSDVRDWSIIDVAAAAESVTIIAQENNELIRYRVRGADDVDRQIINIDAVEFNGVGIVDVGSAQMLVGSVAQSTTQRVAMYDITDPAQAREVPIDGAELDFDISVRSVSATDSELLIGGRRYRQNMIWRIELADLVEWL